MLKKLFIILLAVIASSCQQTKRDNPSVNGAWKSLGSGWVLHIKDSLEYSLYDITSISCLLNREGKFEELQKSLTIINDTLELEKGVITYQFIRSDGLPTLCETLSNEKKNNALYNFEVFATTVKENYAFFELNDIDWDKLYKSQRSKLTEKSTDVDLYLVIEETLEKLKDNHAYLEAPKEVLEAVESLPQQLEEVDTKELPNYGDFEVAQMVAKHHLQKEMTTDSWLIQWGQMTDKIGFIQIKAMWLYADLDIPEQLVEEMGYVDAYVATFTTMYEGDYINKEVAAVSSVMDNVMDDLLEMESIVIDLRFNGGGQDAVGFEILSRFIPQDQLKIAGQKLKFGNHFTPILPLYIEGKKNAYTKPIYVLTSQQTGSAAEAFSIATMALNNVKRIGSRTSGALSTALEKQLPNGWHFSISNEVYLDNNANLYENIGVPVDYEMNYPQDRQHFFRSVVNDLEVDRKNILSAIEKLNEN